MTISSRIDSNNHVYNHTEYPIIPRRKRFESHANYFQGTEFVPSPNLQGKEFKILEEESRDTSSSAMIEEEEFKLVEVKQEPQDSIHVCKKKRKNIKEIEKKLPLINPFYNHEKEIDLELCLPCNIIVHNWINGGLENPETVNPIAWRQDEHMTPSVYGTQLLQDPLLENLNTPSPFFELDKEGNLKEYNCLTGDLPLSFSPVNFKDLEKYILNDASWNQYEKGGKTFKNGFLYLPYRNDETKAHILSFYYYQVEKNKKIKENRMYILEPSIQPPKVYSVKNFVKEWANDYADEIYIWYGQNNINYDCNKTLKEMFENSVKEEEDDQQKTSTQPINKLKRHIDYARNEEISSKRFKKDDKENPESLEQTENIENHFFMTEFNIGHVNEVEKYSNQNNNNHNFSWKKVSNLIESNNPANLMIQSSAAEKETTLNEKIEMQSIQVPFFLNTHMNHLKASNPFDNEVEQQNDLFSLTEEEPSESEIIQEAPNEIVDLNLSNESFKTQDHTGEQEFLLYEKYIFGLGVERDAVKATHYLTLSAEKGFPKAQYELGINMYIGNEVESDLDEARRLFTLAAEKGHPGAQWDLGLMCYHGKGGKKDLAETIRLFTLAAENGVPGTKWGIDRGIDNRVSPDVCQPINLYTIAAKQGEQLALAELYCLTNGLIVSAPCAMYNLGEMYLKGEGVPKNENIAIHFFFLVADFFPAALAYLKELANRGNLHAKEKLEKLEIEKEIQQQLQLQQQSRQQQQK